MTTKITGEMVKNLREMTGAAFVDCKKALEASDGNTEAAVDFLKKKSQASAVKRMDREASEGIVASYIHGNGKIGVLVEVNCETDFVARNELFQQLVKDVAMQVAAQSPLYVAKSDIPEMELVKQRVIFTAQAAESGKPEAVISKIVEGRMQKWVAEVCLMEQPFIKDADQTILELMKSVIAKTGENIRVRRFARFQLGEKL